MESRLQIQPTREAVRRACAFVAQAAQAAGMDEQAVYHCEIAVDEACSNIVQHGFDERGFGSEIVLHVTTDLIYFTITILDNSSPFDPLSKEDPTETDEYKREPGGWGIYFVKKLMDYVSYSYHDGQNTLILRKRVSSDSTNASV